MQVDGVSLQAAHAVQPKIQHVTDLNVEEPPEELSGNTEISEPSGIQPQPDNHEQNNDEDVKGVIRLLQQGHFKGVADVRLRISHFDELFAIERGQIQTVAAEKVDGVLESVGTGIEILLESDDLIEELAQEGAAAVLELQETFVHAINQAKEEFLAAEIPSKDALVSNLNNAFESFVEPLLNLSASAIEASEEEPAPANFVEETDSVSSEGEGEENNDLSDPAAPTAPEPDFQTFVEDLRAAFASAMDELTSGLSEVKVLPALSEPSGNGEAYNKFVAIYNELWGVGIAADGPAGEPLDLVV